MTRKISSHFNMGRELQDRPDKLTLCIDVNEEKRDFNAEESLPPE
jgi:hypothetical protein